MSGRVLHVLSQRPGRTGSGTTLDALVRLAGAAGWRQQAVVGVPVDETEPRVGDLPASAVHPVTFAAGDEDAGDAATGPTLGFPVPGMSDVMPYASSVWSALTGAELGEYRVVWRRHLERICRDFSPDLIHTNHIWLVSAQLREIVPKIPIVATCHATGLRQLELCPDLRDEVVSGCQRLDHFLVLRHDHREQLSAALDVPIERVTVVGAGYRDDLFRRAPTGADPADPGQILYVGKLSEAKGLPWLLDAVAALAARHPGLHLHVAGDGAGPEADFMRARGEAMDPLVTMHGALDQPALADLMRRCSICVLPSFYEGVPLVLVEAAACGCRLVATDLPGIREQIVPHLGDLLEVVPLPRLRDVDRPDPDDLPCFTRDLGDALERAVIRATANPGTPPADLVEFTWQAVFGRIEAVWRELLADD